jgi:hypothetical protein
MDAHIGPAFAPQPRFNAGPKNLFSESVVEDGEPRARCQFLPRKNKSVLVGIFCEAPVSLATDFTDGTDRKIGWGGFAGMTRALKAGGGASVGRNFPKLSFEKPGASS